MTTRAEMEAAMDKINPDARGSVGVYGVQARGVTD